MKDFSSWYTSIGMPNSAELLERKWKDNTTECSILQLKAVIRAKSQLDSVTTAYFKSEIEKLQRNGYFESEKGDRREKSGSKSYPKKKSKKDQTIPERLSPAKKKKH